MVRLIGKFTLIILINLFAFLSVGYILDGIFESGVLFKIIFLILSIFSLVLISIFFFKSSLKTINDIDSKTGSEESDDNINNK